MFLPIFKIAYIFLRAAGRVLCILAITLLHSRGVTIVKEFTIIFSSFLKLNLQSDRVPLSMPNKIAVIWLLIVSLNSAFKADPTDSFGLSIGL